MRKGLVFSIIVGVLLIAVGGAILGIGLANRQPEEVTTKTVAFEDNFSKINVDIDTANLTFVVSDGETKAVVEQTEDRQCEVSVKDGELVITQIDNREWYEKIFSFESEELNITVYIPSKIYGTFVAKASTGSISVPSGYTFESVNIEVSTGSVSFSSVVTNSLKAEASTGQIEIKNTQAKTMNLKASTGEVDINNVSVMGEVLVSVSTGSIDMTDLKAVNLKATASTGNVKVKKTLITSKMTIETSTGNVVLDDSDAKDIYIETSTGDVRGTIKTAKQFNAHSDTGSVKVPLSLGDGVCKITTDTGDINISIKD